MLHIRELLRDPSCPYGVMLLERELRPVLVEDLRRFIGSRLDEPSGLDEAITRAVQALGGRREPMSDPWSAPRRLLLALLGRPRPCTDVWLVPAAGASRR